MPDDVHDDRLDRLRGDLAALRAKTAEEFGVELTGRSPADGEAPERDHRAAAAGRPAAGGDRAGSGTTQPPGSPPPAVVADGGAGTVDADEDGWGPAATSGRRAPWRTLRAPRSGRAPRPPRPPRRSPFRRRARRPPSRLAVPSPIEVRRRPSYLAAPRWPTWTWISGAVVGAVAIPAVLQLTYRLLQAMQETSVLLGADPSRSDHLHAAAGVAGGGLTLALAVAALAVVRGRPGYLAAAVSVVVAFCVFPFVAYPAVAGIVSAPLPPFEELLRPPRWDGHAFLTASFWLCAGALVAAVGDLAYRSAAALQRWGSGRLGRAGD